MNARIQRLRHWLYWKTGWQWLLPVFVRFMVRVPKPPTVELLTHLMEIFIPVGAATECNRSVTGEHYVEYSLGSLAPNAEEILCRAMWQSFVMQFIKSDCPQELTLYWRCKPVVEDAIHGKGIYVRYLLSAKPQIYSDTADVIAHTWTAVIGRAA